MVNCSRDKTNKTNFGEKLSNSIDTMATIIVTLFADCVSLRLKAPEKKLSVADSSPHGRIVQTRSTTRHDREAKEPQM
jgi:hypothetical protein